MTVWSVRVVRRLVLIGLGVMGTVGLAAAIWRPVAGFVAGVPVAPAAAVMVVEEPDATVFAESAPASARLKKPA